MINSEDRVKDIVRAEEPVDDGLVRVHAPLASTSQELAIARPAAYETLPNKLAGSLFVCLGAVIGGLITSAYYAKQVSLLEAQRKAMDAESASIAQSAQIGSAEARDLARYSILSKRGVPLIGVMDEVTHSLPAGVGLTAVVINQNGQTRIEGEATSEEAMLQTLQNLKQGHSLENLTIIGFRRDDEEQSGGRFAFGGRCISMSDVRIGGTP